MYVSPLNQNSLIPSCNNYYTDSHKSSLILPLRIVIIHKSAVTQPLKYRVVRTPQSLLHNQLTSTYLVQPTRHLQKYKHKIYLLEYAVGNIASRTTRDAHALSIIAYIINNEYEPTKNQSVSTSDRYAVQRPTCIWSIIGHRHNTMFQIGFYSHVLIRYLRAHK